MACRLLLNHASLFHQSEGNVFPCELRIKSESAPDCRWRVRRDHEGTGARLLLLHRLRKNTIKFIPSLCWVQCQLKAKMSSMLEQRNLIGLSHLLAQNAAQLDSEIIYDRDFEYDYFGFKTLERSYLLKVNGRVVERPQHLLMRVAVGIHKANIEGVLKTYHTMSQRWFTHGSPTLFNAGTPRPQVRCFTLISYPNMSLFWTWNCS